MEQKKITFDSFVRNVMWVLTAIGIVMLLNYLSGVLLPFFLAWLISYLLFPLVKFFQYRCKLKFRILGIFAAVLTVGIVLTGLFMLMIIFGAAASIVRIYAGIAIGHQFNDHRILMSIVALIGFNMIGTTLTTICSNVGMYFGVFDSMSQIFEANSTQALYMAQGGMILFLLAQTAFFGVITWLLLDRKLNLE